MPWLNPNPPTTGGFSITARLALLSTLATTVVLLFAIVFQFLTLTTDLEFEDNDFLADKIRVIQEIVLRYPDDLARLEEEVYWEGGLRHATRYLARIIDREGRVIMETQGMAEVLPTGVFPSPTPRHRPLGRGKKRPGAQERTYLVNAAWSADESDPSVRLIQVALDVTDEVAIIEGYKEKMALVFAAGLGLSAILSVVVARRGLRPLGDLTEAAGRVDVTSLDQRLGGQAWPRELANFTRAFDAMLDRLGLGFERLSDTSANLAHEMRTPINNLRGEAEVALSRTRSNEEYRRVIESSLEEYERLSRMIDNILFLARSDVRIELLPLSLTEELERLRDYYGTLAEEREIALTCHGGGTLIADPLLFQRAVGNLLSNALRYTPTGGTITVTTTRNEDGATHLTVTDTGIGIAADELPKVFDRFYRSGEARTLHAEGNGLGLTIVQSVMALHQGSVSIVSTPGRGTAVTLHFPPPAEG